MVRLKTIALLVTVLAHPDALAAAQSSIPPEVQRNLLIGQTSAALPWLKQAADTGNPEAAFLLGKLYRLGHGVKKDQHNARHYLGIAARGDIAPAQYLFALHLQADGREDEARDWLQRAHSNGHAQAGEHLRAQASAPNLDAFTLIDKHTPTNGAYRNVDWRSPNDNGETPLIYAARNANQAWTTYLAANLPRDALAAQDAFGNTALHYVVQQQDLDALGSLLDAGADVRAQNLRGAAPLHLAVAAKATAAAARLIEAGADLNQSDHSGWSPLMLAQREGFKLAAAQAMATTKSAPTGTGELDKSLLRAVKTEQTELVRDLLSQGANPDALTSTGQSALDLSIDYGNTETTRLLLKHGARADTNNALLTAIRSSNAATVTLLLRFGADAKTQDRLGRGALHVAAMTDCTTCIESLLDVQPDLLDMPDPRGRTPLWWATSMHRVSSAAVLVRYNAALDADEHGISPLHIAMEHTDRTLLKMLIKRASPATLQTTSAAGNTLLHLAARHDNTEAVAALLASGTAVDVENSSGDTPLMVAASASSLACAAILIEAGASLNRRNKRNVSARDVMASKQDAAWAELLKQAPSELESLFARLGRG